MDYGWILQLDVFSSPFHFSVAATMSPIIPIRRNMLNSYCVLRYHRVRFSVFSVCAISSHYYNLCSYTSWFG
jgi:hypothetical protein